MKDTVVNEALLDLVVETANNLGKHHADQALELVSDDVSEQLKVRDKTVDEVVNLVSDIEQKQTDFKEQLSQLTEQLASVKTSCEDYTSTVDDQAIERDQGSANTIDKLTRAINELSDIVDSNDDINLLADLVKTHGEAVESLNSGTSEALEKFNDSFIEVSDVIEKLAEEVEGNERDVGSVVQSLSEEITSVSDDINLRFNKNETKHEKLLQPVLREVSKFNDVVDSLTVSITRSGECLNELDKDVGGKLNKLRGAKLNHGKQLDAQSKKLIGLSKDIESFGVNSAKFKVDVDELIVALSQQFSALKNESFLSNDKIDLKFAELKLVNVESDVKRTEIVIETISQLSEDLKNGVYESFDDYKDIVDKRISGDTKSVIESVDKLLANDKELLNRAKAWENGPSCGAGVMVRNLGGVWQAVRSTREEPTRDSNDWICLFSSYYRATKVSDHCNGVETVIGLHDSLGHVTELTIPTPSIRYLKGVYEKDGKYSHLDSIMKDGCRWVATKDDPQGIPGDEEADWQVLTMRGAKGMKGATGDRGAKGLQGQTGEQGAKGAAGEMPTMNSVVKALVDFESASGGQSIRRARGHWKLGVKYKAGDVSNVGKGLFLAVKDNDGMQTPASSTEDWLLLIDATSSSGVSADSSEKYTSTYDHATLDFEIADVGDSYPVDIDLISNNEFQLRINSADRPAGTYVLNIQNTFTIDSTLNKVFNRISTDGGATWENISVKIGDGSEMESSYVAFPITHTGGAMDVLFQIKKEFPLNILRILKASIWIDSKQHLQFLNANFCN